MVQESHSAQQQGVRTPSTLGTELSVLQATSMRCPRPSHAPSTVVGGRRLEFGTRYPFPSSSRQLSAPTPRFLHFRSFWVAAPWPAAFHLARARYPSQPQRWPRPTGNSRAHPAPFDRETNPIASCESCIRTTSSIRTTTGNIVDTNPQRRVQDRRRKATFAA